MKLTHYKISFLFVVLCASMNVHDVHAGNFFASFRFPKLDSFGQSFHPKVWISALFLYILPPTRAQVKKNRKKDIALSNRQTEEAIRTNEELINSQEGKMLELMNSESDQRRQYFEQKTKEHLNLLSQFEGDIDSFRESLQAIRENAQQQSRENRNHFQGSLDDMHKKLDDRFSSMKRKLESELSKNNQIISETREAVDQFGVHAQKAHRMINGLPRRVPIEAQNLKFGVLGALTQQPWNN